MKAFVVNLPRSRDRRAHIDNQLSASGLEHEFVAAVDGRDLTTEEIDQMVDKDLAARAPRWLRRGAIGCSLSHLDAYRRILDQGLEHALVLEDDAILPRNVNELLAWLPPELDRAEAALLYYTAKGPCVSAMRIRSGCRAARACCTRWT